MFRFKSQLIQIIIQFFFYHTQKNKHNNKKTKKTETEHKQICNDNKKSKIKKQKTNQIYTLHNIGIYYISVNM